MGWRRVTGYQYIFVYEGDIFLQQRQIACIRFCTSIAMRRRDGGGGRNCRGSLDGVKKRVKALSWWEFCKESVRQRNRRRHLARRSSPNHILHWASHLKEQRKSMCFIGNYLIKGETKVQFSKSKYNPNVHIVWVLLLIVWIPSKTLLPK